MAPYVDMASIVVATHKTTNSGRMLHNVPHIYIYPNTEGNIGVKNVKIQVVCG